MIHLYHFWAYYILEKQVMSNVAIVTDTNSGLSPEEGRRLGIHVIPMPVIKDGKDYLEHVNINCLCKSSPLLHKSYCCSSIRVFKYLRRFRSSRVFQSRKRVLISSDYTLQEVFTNISRLSMWTPSAIAVMIRSSLHRRVWFFFLRIW